MTKRMDLEVDTLTIRIPMRLQRRGGRKLIMTRSTGAEAEARRDADQGARARPPLAAEDRERSGQVDHRPCGAGGRDGRLRLPPSAAHLPGAGHCGSDPGQAAAEGAQVG